MFGGLAGRTRVSRGLACVRVASCEDALPLSARPAHVPSTPLSHLQRTLRGHPHLLLRATRHRRASFQAAVAYQRLRARLCPASWGPVAKVVRSAHLGVARFGPSVMAMPLRVASPVRMHKYTVAPRIDGIASGRSIEVRSGLVLRAEFVPMAKTSGPYRDLYFKLFPRGTCKIPECIVGFPALNCTPHGLGHTVHHSVHGFAELGFPCQGWSSSAGAGTLPAVANHFLARGPAAGLERRACTAHAPADKLRILNWGEQLARQRSVWPGHVASAGGWPRRMLEWWSVEADATGSYFRRKHGVRAHPIYDYGMAS